MIAITVETDQEAADVRAMLSTGWRWMRGHAYIVVMGDDVIDSELQAQARASGRNEP